MKEREGDVIRWLAKRGGVCDAKAAHFTFFLGMLLQTFLGTFLGKWTGTS